MLDKTLIAKTSPVANAQNIVRWKDYRITVLSDRLFRIEKNENNLFRDQATQVVWFRNMPKQTFSKQEKDGALIIKTNSCKLKIAKRRADCRVSLNGGVWQKIDNTKNLKGTYRTLDASDGNRIFTISTPTYITLGDGVCSKSGVAVIDDTNSLALDKKRVYIA